MTIRKFKFSFASPYNFDIPSLLCRVEQIDEEVKKLEYKMQHTSLTINEEKRTISQINELTKSREFVKVYNERMEKLSGEESSRSEVLERIRQKDAQINALKAQESEQRRLLNSIKDKEQSHTADVPVLQQVDALTSSLLKCSFRSVASWFSRNRL
jgi:chromosome segregation ATPase